MTDPTPIDISNIPELVRIAEEVEATKTSRELKRDNKPIALITPIRDEVHTSSRGIKTKADYDAFNKAAGSWKDVDAERLIADIYRWRQEGSRPMTKLE